MDRKKNHRERPLTERQAAVVLELARVPGGHVPPDQLASAMKLPPETWTPRYPGHRETVGMNLVQSVIQQLRRRFGHDIIEGSRGSGPGRPSRGFRLTERGWELLGPAWRE